MDVTEKNAKSILTAQQSGFLAEKPYPFTHALSSYTGCGFGQTTCGMYCYAQFLPNWQFSGFTAPWGQAVGVKSNAADLLEMTLSKMKPEARRHLRIFMSSITDPYQPLEGRYEITRRCLEVFARYTDLDLLVIQTRSPLALRDLDLMQRIPYVMLSVTIETDDQSYLKQMRGGPTLEKRWELVRSASEQKIPTQITVSPCLPYSDVAQFAERLLGSGARRLIIDSLIDGDGSKGERSARSPFARTEQAWRDTQLAAQTLYAYLQEHVGHRAIEISWSVQGFCGIPPRARQETLV